MRSHRSNSFSAVLRIGLIAGTLDITDNLIFNQLRGVTPRDGVSVSGLIYGGFVYLFMNFVVLPLSGVPPRRAPMTIAARINGVLAVVLFIGLTISLLVRRSDAAESRGAIESGGARRAQRIP